MGITSAVVLFFSFLLFFFSCSTFPLNFPIVDFIHPLLAKPNQWKSRTLSTFQDVSLKHLKYTASMPTKRGDQLSETIE